MIILNLFSLQMSLFISPLHWSVSPESTPTYLDLNCQNWPKYSRICLLRFIYIYHHQLAIFPQNTRSAVGQQLKASSTSCNPHSFPQFVLTLSPYYFPRFPSFILIHFLPPSLLVHSYITYSALTTDNLEGTIKLSGLQNIIPLVFLHQVTNLNP